MFGGNRARREIALRDEELRIARGRLAEGVIKLDRALTDDPIQEMVRKALKKVSEANNRAPRTD